MIRNVIHTLRVTVPFLIICCVLGCQTVPFPKDYHFYRSYSGLPLPSDEIALVYVVGSCQMFYLHDKREKEKNLVDTPEVLDLLPGQYIADICYQRFIQLGVRELGGCLQLTLNVHSGNIYMVYPEITGRYPNQKWRPIFVNINDYNKEECEKYCEGFCPRKEMITKSIAEYMLCRGIAVEGAAPGCGICYIDPSGAPYIPPTKHK